MTNTNNISTARRALFGSFAMLVVASMFSLGFVHTAHAQEDGVIGSYDTDGSIGSYDTGSIGSYAPNGTIGTYTDGVVGTYNNNVDGVVGTYSSNVDGAIGTYVDGVVGTYNNNVDGVIGTYTSAPTTYVSGGYAGSYYPAYYGYGGYYGGGSYYGSTYYGTSYYPTYTPNYGTNTYNSSTTYVSNGYASSGSSGSSVIYSGSTYSYPVITGVYPVAMAGGPSVSLSAIPYTGLDLGVGGTIAYWSFLILWCLFAAYLITVKRVHNKLITMLFGEKDAHVAVAAHQVHEAVAHKEQAHAGHGHDTHGASHAKPHAHAPVAAATQVIDPIDPFIQSQIANRTEK